MKKLFTILILTTFLLGGCQLPSPPFGASDTLKEVSPETKVKDINVLKYKNNQTGLIEEFEVLKSEYDEVALNNKKKDGYTFISGYAGHPIMATTILNDNEYYAISTTTAMIKLTGKAEQTIDRSLIIDNKITQELLGAIK